MQDYRLKFNARADMDFASTLRRRVGEYFQENNITRYGNSKMIVKVSVVLAVYFATYIAMNFIGITSVPVYLSLWVLQGLATAAVGVNCMHDANHNSLSKHNWVNTMFSHSMDIIGANSRVWKTQHNVLHHTYTNVLGADEDIEGFGLLRFTPHQKAKWFFKYQHYYAWILYGLMLFARLFNSDYKQALIYYRKGIVKTKTDLYKEFAQITFWKTIYLGYMLGIPLYMGVFSPAIVLIGFSISIFIAGLLLAVIFQAAHVLEDCEFPLPDSSNSIDSNWLSHQLRTTCNFAPDNKVLSWLLGGLNYQVEHHLFSNICHVHYQKLRHVVKQTAEEFGQPYFVKTSFTAAIISHARILKQLGRAA